MTTDDPAMAAIEAVIAQATAQDIHGAADLVWEESTRTNQTGFRIHCLCGWTSEVNWSCEEVGGQFDTHLEGFDVHVDDDPW